jgi:hypothetical protein
MGVESVCLFSLFVCCASHGNICFFLFHPTAATCSSSISTSDDGGMSARSRFRGNALDSLLLTMAGYSVDQRFVSLRPSMSSACLF